MTCSRLWRLYRLFGESNHGMRVIVIIDPRGIVYLKRPTTNQPVSRHQSVRGCQLIIIRENRTTGRAWHEEQLKRLYFCMSKCCRWRTRVLAGTHIRNGSSSCTAETAATHCCQHGRNVAKAFPLNAAASSLMITEEPFQFLAGLGSVRS